ncbi:MAG: hypothetical protein R3358_09490, partial [Woeseiaceae bacterium]|nr:hypothetical protein [Woeseiaceae bacterium]
MTETNSPLAAIRKHLWIVILAVLAAVGWYATTLDSSAIESQGHYGFLSIMPALAALVICFATRNVILALFMGVILGGLVTMDYNIIQSFLVPAIGTTRFAEILLVYLWALGGLLGIWN